MPSDLFIIFDGETESRLIQPRAIKRNLSLVSIVKKARAMLGQECGAINVYTKSGEHYELVRNRATEPAKFTKVESEEGHNQ